MNSRKFKGKIRKKLQRYTEYKFSLIQSNKQKTLSHGYKIFSTPLSSFLYSPCPRLGTVGRPALVFRPHRAALIRQFSASVLILRLQFGNLLLGASAEMRWGDGAELLVVRLSQALEEEVKFCTAVFLGTFFHQQIYILFGETPS